MKMLLFRPTFVIAGFMLVVVLCTFVITASAAPQFGRPLLHALDEAPAASGSVTPADGGVVSFVPSNIGPTLIVDPSPSPTVDCEDQDPAPDPVSVVNPTQPPTINSTTTTTTLAQANGAPHSLGSTNAALMLAVVASGIFIIF
ncbi:hypothetical protein BS17DRAFT_83282 [Gyrodon lividus]|nr:hypothetical protein BS17DRAFT_83282 [Gyrodon lividus]